MSHPPIEDRLAHSCRDSWVLNIASKSHESPVLSFILPKTQAPASSR